MGRLVGGSDGVLCGLSEKVGSNFIVTWIAVTFLALQFVFLCSGLIFYHLYWPTKVTYDKWRWKTNAKYPTPEKVRDEIVQTLKGSFTAALCPAAAMWLYSQGDACPIPFYAYCGTTPEYGWRYNLFCFFLVWFVSDFWESYYHYLGHKYPFMWNWHRHHHVFFNPSPFAVVADEFVDQFIRALPLVLFPVVVPMNLDILYGTFVFLFYGTGSYHHCGYEVAWPNAHTGFFNTSYHHYLHHSISVNQKPYHCGFMFQCWDQMLGSIYHGKCFCVKCAQEQGLRSPEKFKEVQVPDYSKLFDPKFWLNDKLLSVFAGTSASDQNEELLSKDAQANAEVIG